MDNSSRSSDRFINNFFVVLGLIWVLALILLLLLVFASGLENFYPSLALNLFSEIVGAGITGIVLALIAKYWLETTRHSQAFLADYPELMQPIQDARTRYEDWKTWREYGSDLEEIRTLFRQKDPANKERIQELLDKWDLRLVRIGPQTFKLVGGLVLVDPKQPNPQEADKSEVVDD